MSEESSASDPHVSYILQNYFTDYVLMGTSGALFFVQEARALAKHLGATGDDAIRRALGLQIGLGVKFMEDPQLLAVCSSAAQQTGLGALMSLGEAARAYLRQTAGLKGGCYQRALVRASKLPSGKLSRLRIRFRARRGSIALRDLPRKGALVGQCDTVVRRGSETT
ncbi:MAG: hypothetical protein QM784_09115 [Polyangiaceae bacterium]